MNTTNIPPELIEAFNAVAKEVGNAYGFAKEQLPFVAQEIIAQERISASCDVVINALIVAFCVAVAIVAYKITLKRVKADCPSMILFGFMSLVAAVCAVGFTTDAISRSKQLAKTYYAPRLVLIEAARNLTR